MTTTTPHPYADILRAIADGKNVQWQNSGGSWQNQSVSETLMEISNEEYSPARYRVAPRTITINGHEVPEPLREMPPDGTEVYWPSFGPEHGGNNTVGTEVGNFKDRLAVMLLQGLLHLTPKAAQAHAEALLSFTKVGD